MLSPAAKTKRSLEAMQIMLTFLSVCAVVDASWIHTRPHDQTGYEAEWRRHSQARGDRLFRDLARTERKRREAALRDSLEQRQLRA